MKAIPTAIPGVILLEPKVFQDARGYFLETYRKSEWNVEFVQDNLSFSKKGVLRGLHYQLENPQGKLVEVISGEVFDVAVDMRKNSDTFGKWVGFILSEENKRVAYIPPGFAHGFLTLSETAHFTYKCTDYYTPGDEHTLLWNDETVAITWPMKEVLLSEKDRLGQPFKLAKTF